MRKWINTLRRMRCDCGHRVFGFRLGKCLVVEVNGKSGLWCPECSRKVAMTPTWVSISGNRGKGGRKMRKVWTILGVLVVAGIVGSLPWAGTGIVKEADSSTTDQVTITRTPCYPIKVVQLDSDFPLTPPANGECGSYTKYLEDFWDNVTKEVTFMYGNDTVRVYAVAVGWEETRTECETTTSRYQESYSLNEE